MSKYIDRLHYDEESAGWLGRFSERNLEVYIAGNRQKIDPDALMLATNTLANFEAIEYRVKSYLAETQTTEIDGKSIGLERPIPETMWEVMWLNFWHTARNCEYELVCHPLHYPDFSYLYLLWIVTVVDDIPIAHLSEYW